MTRKYNAGDSVRRWLLLSAGCVMFCTVGCGSSDPKPGEPGDPGPTATCISTDDCSPGSYCLMGVCETGNAGDSDAVGPGAGCDCPGLQVCDSEGACAEPEICTTDADCIAPGVCVTGACAMLPECREDFDCGPDAGCFTAYGECGDDTCSGATDCPSALKCHALGFCADCAADGDCPGSQVCLAGSCEEAATCGAPEDCTRGRVCDASDCINPTCVDDAFEPNEDFAEADASTAWSAGLQNFSVCRFEKDTFFVPVDAGDGVLTRAIYDRSLGIAFVNAYDASEEFIAGAEGSDGVLVFGVEHIATAGVYLRYHVEPGLDVPMEVLVQTFPGGLCFDDFTEPNNSRHEAVAHAHDVTGPDIGLITCPDDEDWLTTHVPAGQTLQVTADTYTADAPIVELYDQAGTLLLRDSSASDAKLLVATNAGDTSAEYAVRLIAAPGLTDSAIVFVGFATTP